MGKAKQSRKVYYSFYPNAKKAHPVIHLAGKYLAEMGFKIGEMVEVQMERGKIVISRRGSL